MWIFTILQANFCESDQLPYSFCVTSTPLHFYLIFFSNSCFAIPFLLSRSSDVWKFEIETIAEKSMEKNDLFHSSPREKVNNSLLIGHWYFGIFSAVANRFNVISKFAWRRHKNFHKTNQIITSKWKKSKTSSLDLFIYIFSSKNEGHSKLEYVVFEYYWILIQLISILHYSSLFERCQRKKRRAN